MLYVQTDVPMYSRLQLTASPSVAHLRFLELTILHDPFNAITLNRARTEIASQLFQGGNCFESIGGFINLIGGEFE